MHSETNEDTIMQKIAVLRMDFIEKCQSRVHPEGYCPPIVTEIRTSISCWNATPPGTFANMSCPSLNHLFNTSQLVFKECWPNGTWYVRPQSQTGADWTNYSLCIQHDELEFNLFINKLFVIGYTISLVALILSLIIFLSFRSLRCTRIRLHIQLFLSFIMNNIMWLIWYLEVIPIAEYHHNPLWCQAVEVLLKYFLIANYMWMFCEGLYLHISLVMVFVKDNVAWIWFLMIGWGVPFIIVLIYACTRIFSYKDTQDCWLNPSEAELIYRIPVGITILISFIFFCYVLRVIVNIINPNSKNPTPMRIRRAARAALILIPLFGVQYLLIPFRPHPGEAFAHLYEYMTVIITSPQGLCVSILFCFANQDVLCAINLALRRRWDVGGSWRRYAPPGDHSAGVFVINSNGRTSLSSSIRMV